MTCTVLAETTASISDLKKNPMGVINQGKGFPVAILNCNQPIFYCIPAKAYEDLLNKIEDMEINTITFTRTSQE